MRKKKKKNSGARWLAGLLVLSILIVYIFHTDTVQKRFFYPFPYQKSVERYASINKVDPLLVISIIKAESSFDSNAVSRVGAMGLMQLMPDSAEWIAGQAGTTLNGSEALLNPEKSIELGSWYIESLCEEWHGNLVLALAAYNAGRGVVDGWVKEHGWQRDFSDVEQIPYKETKNFVRRVMDNYSVYKKLYRSDS